MLNAECLNEMTYALTAYSHQNKPGKVLDMVRILVSAPWQTLHPLVRIKNTSCKTAEFKTRNMSYFGSLGQIENDESLGQI